MDKLEPIDKKGRSLEIGDWVRIIDLPPTISDLPVETRKVFGKSLGNTFKIEGFGRYGHLELEVWKKLKLEGMDTIYIEPFCVLRSRRRKKVVQ